MRPLEAFGHHLKDIVGQLATLDRLQRRLDERLTRSVVLAKARQGSDHAGGDLWVDGVQLDDDVGERRVALSAGAVEVDDARGEAADGGVDLGRRGNRWWSLGRGGERGRGLAWGSFYLVGVSNVENGVVCHEGFEAIGGRRGDVGCRLEAQPLVHDEAVVFPGLKKKKKH